MPSPLKKSFAAEQLRQRQKKSPATMIILVVAVIIAVIAVGYALYMRFGKKEIPTETVIPPAEEKRPSIAVLPFRNLSDDKQDEYFSDGITEDIIARLAKIGDLKVISSTSVMQYKNTEKSLPVIGKELGVENILEGSVRRADNQIRIVSQLIKAQTDEHMWVETYDRELKDVFAIQEEIALAIADSLQVEILGNERAAIAKRPTDNIEAYQLYLKGRYFWNKRNEEGFNKALDYFRQACDEDPNYSLAYAGIADTYSLKGFYSYLPPKVAYPIAKAAAEKALQFDDTLAESHASLARIYFSYYWYWSEAENEFKRAIELNPNYATAHHWYAIYLMAMGRFDEAIAEIKRAQELDPLSLQINVNFGSLFYNVRKYDEAFDSLHKTLLMDPSHPTTYWYLGMAYYAKAMWEEAIEADKKFVTLSGGSPLSVSALGSAYAASGQIDEALKMLDRLNKLSKERYVSPYHFSLIYFSIGEMDKAFEYLEKAYVEREPLLVYIKITPFHDPFRSDPRFKALLKKMGLD